MVTDTLKEPGPLKTMPHPPNHGIVHSAYYICEFGGFPVFSRIIRENRRFLLVLSVLSGLGCQPGLPNTPPPSPFVSAHPVYAALSRRERIQQADAIVRAEVQAISPTRWNSDSGQPWTPLPPEIPDRPVPVPIHTVTLRVIQTLAAREPLPDSIEVVVVGNSPLEAPPAHQQWVKVPAEHQLHVGDSIVAFLSRRDLVWEGGRRSVWMFIGFPAASYLKARPDGRWGEEVFDGPPEERQPLRWEELEAQIRALRSP